MRERWAVFISGRGSNLSAVLSGLHFSKHLVAVVVTNKAKCDGAFKARRAGVPVLTFDFKNWDCIDQKLRSRGVNRILLAGFMKIIPESFVEKWQGQIINIHPSLLPAYPGLKSIERAYHEKAPIGVTLHEVIAAVDEGNNIVQETVKMNQPSSIQEVKARVHRCEHRLVRRVLSRWSYAG